MKIGYIGIGLMGGPCCENLLSKGYPLYLWARRPESAQSLVERGAVLLATPKEVASNVDILFTNVTNAPDVENILFRPDGVVASGKKGLIIIDMSTISAEATRGFAGRLRTVGMEFVDAPVSGGTIGAQKGTLTFMVGADDATFERIQPILMAMGTTITHIGPSGAGQVAKSCNQIVITAAIAGVAEAYALAQAQGVGFAAVRQALLGGAAASTVLERYGQRLLDDNFSPGFKTDLHLKDLGIVAALMSQSHLDLPVTKAGLELLQKAQQKGYGHEDSLAMAKVILTESGLA